MKTEQKITWQNNVKNLLFVIFVLCVVILPQTIILGWKGNTEGIIVSTVILFIGISCLFVAARWHRQDIHITALGFWIGAVIFTLSPFIVWWLQLFLWPNIIISIYFLGKPTLLFLKEKGWKSFLRGISYLFTWGFDHRSYEKRFGNDAELLASDWEKVGNDICNATQQFEKNLKNKAN